MRLGSTKPTRPYQNICANTSTFVRTLDLDPLTKVFGSTYGSFIFLDPCGGILDQNFGTFKSVDRNLDGSYENDDHCLWNITVANGTTMQLKFLDLDIRGDNQMCLQDYIKVP